MPTRAAAFVAAPWSCQRRHSSARSTRPPSIGYAGIRLNTASTAFASMTYVPRSPSAVPTRPGTNRSTANKSASATTVSAPLIAGPANATSASAFGDPGSSSSVATPPNKNSVIARVRTPKRRATSACASSCATTLANSTSAQAAPNAYASPPGSAVRPRASAIDMNA